MKVNKTTEPGRNFVHKHMYTYNKPKVQDSKKSYKRKPKYANTEY